MTEQSEPAYVTRMKREHHELDDKISKLEDFRETNLFGSMEPDDQHLLNTQLNAMRAYISILSIRIDKASA